MSLQLVHVLPAPSNGEFAPVFSISADFDILISAEGKTPKQVSTQVCVRREVQKVSRVALILILMTRGERVRPGVDLTPVELEHFQVADWANMVESFMSCIQHTFIHSFQSVVEQKSGLTEGVDF